MRLRLSETPWGGARFVYSYLGAIVSAMLTGLVLLIASPVASALPVCKADTGGFCVTIITAVIGIIALFGSLFLVAYAMRLGWQWAGWVVALTLLATQFFIDFSQPHVAWALLVIPALAALITFERPDTEPPRWVGIVRIVALALIAVEFIVWFIVLVAS